MLRVWGRPDSSNVQKVMWICAEMGVEVERIDIGGKFGGNREPEYLAKNPNGLVPTLEDGDFVLWESHSIVRYVCEKFGPEPWYPADAEKRGRANQWMDWVLSTLGVPMGAVFVGLVRTPPEKRDAGAIEAARQKAADLWALVDAQLAGRPYIAGEAPTTADVAFGPNVYRWFNMDIERPPLPNVKAYFERLAERPAYRQHLMLPLT